MLPYYFLILVLVSLGVGAAGLRDPIRRRLVILSSLLLIAAFAGLRTVTVGTDTLGYLIQYRSGYQREGEIGYTLLSSLASSMGLPFQTFLLLVSLLVTGAVATAFYLYSQTPWQSFYLHVTMGLFVMSMSGLRQSLAAAIAVVAIVMLLKDRRILFVVLVVVAYTFHNSALVLMPLVLLSRVRLTRRGGALALVAAAIVATQSQIVAVMVGWTGLQKYDVYLEQVAEINPLVIVVSFLVPSACLILWPEEPVEWNHRPGDRVSAHSVMYLLAVLNFACVALASDVPILTRLSYYFITFSAVLIPNSIASTPNGSVRLFASTGLLLLPLVMFALSVPGSSLGVVPYRSVLGR